MTETFNLTSGEVASEERRTEDLILYRLGGALTASFPIVPSRTFAVAELASGTVHLDILAGRETVRGQTGGSEPVSLTSGEATFSVGRGALAEDTAVTFQSVVLSSFLPASAELTPVAEFSIDLSGRTLGLGAELSVPALAVQPYDPVNDTLLIARVERVAGIPRFVVVALASVVGDRVVSQAYPGLAGLTRGGRYVLYHATVPIGLWRASRPPTPHRRVRWSPRRPCRSLAWPIATAATSSSPAPATRRFGPRCRAPRSARRRPQLSRHAQRRSWISPSPARSRPLL